MAEILTTRMVFDGWSKLSIATVRGADGRTFERVIEDHGSAACVLPYDPERKTAVLVSQFRAPVCAMSGRTELLETVAGLTDGEEPATAAIREAFEEAGLNLQTLEPVTAVWSMPGVSTERMSLYLARYSPADFSGRGGGHEHEHENIRVVEMPLRQLAKMVDDGSLDDLKTFALIQTLRLRQPALFA